MSVTWIFKKSLRNLFLVVFTLWKKGFREKDYFVLIPFNCKTSFCRLVLIILEFMNIVSILHFTYIEFIILIYSFLTFFCLIKETIYRISFSTFSDVLLAFIGITWRICLDFNIWSLFPELNECLLHALMQNNHNINLKSFLVHQKIVPYDLFWKKFVTSLLPVFALDNCFLNLFYVWLWLVLVDDRWSIINIFTLLIQRLFSLFFNSFIKLFIPCSLIISFQCS